MANTGYQRSKTLTVTKTKGGIVSGYPKTYNIQDAFGDYDWYLPSYNELLQIYTNLYLESIGDFGIHIYLSSTQNATNEAKAYNFQLGLASNPSKTSSYYVRPVRHFTSSTVFSLGDFGQAGYIFYIDPLGGGSYKYYEAAKVNLEVQKTWGLTTNNIVGTSSDIGTGAANTALIVAVETGKAANYCSELGYPPLNDTEFAQLSTANYNARLAAFYDYVSEIEGTDIEEVTTNEARIENTTNCPVPPTPTYSDWYLTNPTEYAAMFTELKAYGLADLPGSGDGFATIYWTNYDDGGTGNVYLYWESGTWGFADNIANSTSLPARPVRTFVFNTSVVEYNVRDLMASGCYIFLKEDLGSGNYRYYECAPSDAGPNSYPAIETDCINYEI